MVQNNKKKTSKKSLSQDVPLGASVSYKMSCIVPRGYDGMYVATKCLLGVNVRECSNVM